MGHDTNAFDANRRISPGVWLRYGFAVLLLAAVLLDTVFGKTKFLNNLGNIVFIALEVALVNFLVEAAGFLHSHRKMPLCQPTKKRENKPKNAASAVVEVLDETGGTPSAPPASEFLTQTVFEPRAAQADTAEAHSGSPDACAFEARKTMYDQDEKCSAAPQQLRFGFQDTRNALNIIDSIRQGPIFLALADDGILVGRKTGDGQYIVMPGEECLTEEDLRYSPVAACFEIIGLSNVRQKARVRCEKPAVLTETGNGLYIVTEKGQLTVVSTIG